MAPEEAVMTERDDEARLAELAAIMLQAAARLPRDWPKELRPADPAVGEDNKRGDKKDD